MKQEWPQEKIKTPQIEVKGKIFSPKSDPIQCEEDDLVFEVKLTTDWNKEAIQEKREHEQAIYNGKLAKVKNTCFRCCYCFLFFVLFVCVVVVVRLLLTLLNNVCVCVSLLLFLGSILRLVA